MADANGEPPESASALLSNAAALEKELQAVVRKKGVLEKEAHQLRRSLRLCYTNLLLNHYATAVTHDVEQALWKSIFYKVIEALRLRLRRLRSMRPNTNINPTTATHTHTNTNTHTHTPSPSLSDASSASSLDAELQKTASTFSAFVSSAAKFYLGLVAKLESARAAEEDGDDGRKSVGFDKEFGLDSDETPVSQRTHSMYRCYIFLGDLTRYIRDIGGSSTEWLEAAKYYHRALSLVPSSGHPHNQLAVLATYACDDFNSMYHYMRSIAAGGPFPTARENLLVLFEKNRVQAEALVDVIGPSVGSGGGRRRGGAEGRVLRDSFLVFFIRIHGIVFTRGHCEKISQYKTLALKGFEDLLQLRTKSNSEATSSATSPVSPSPSSSPSPSPSPNSSAGISDPLLLKVFVMNIYSVWACLQEGVAGDVTAQSGGGDSFGDKMKRSVLLRHTAKIAVEFFGRTVRACQQAKGSDISFLGPLSIFVDWFVENVTALTPVSSQDKGPWHQMWKAFIALLNRLLELREVDFNEIRSQRGAVTPRKGSEVLVEEIEMRGFLPYKEVHSHISFVGIPQYDFSPFEIQEDASACRRVRIRKLLQFGVRVCSLSIPSLHFSEEKGVFTDRAGKKKSESGRGRKALGGGGVTLAAMDPNAEPINPYESDLSFEGMVGQSPLLQGHYIAIEDDFSEDEEVGDATHDYFFPNDDHLPLDADCADRGPASFKSPNLLSAHSSLSLSDFSYPFPPQNPSEYLDPKSNEPTPLSSPHPSPSGSLSDYSYPFAPPPISIDGRPMERLYSGSWTDASPLESEVASAWNLSVGKDAGMRGRSDVFGASFFNSGDGNMTMDVSRRQSERNFSLAPQNGNDGSSHRLRSLSHLMSNPSHFPLSSPVKLNVIPRSDRDYDTPLSTAAAPAPLPSFFLTSLSNPIKYETLEKGRGEDEEDVNFRTPFEDTDPHADALPIINTGPIEDDEEEEEDEQTTVGMSPLLYSFGAPMSPWQNSLWKATPPQSTAPPPGFAPISNSSSLLMKLSGSEGYPAHRVVSGGMGIGGVGGGGGGGPIRSPQVQIRWEKKDVK